MRITQEVQDRKAHFFSLNFCLFISKKSTYNLIQYAKMLRIFSTQDMKAIILLRLFLFINVYH